MAKKRIAQETTVGAEKQTGEEIETGGEDNQAKEKKNTRESASVFSVKDDNIADTVGNSDR